MGTITPINPNVTGQVVVPATPAASDVIPALAYREVILVLTSTTGTPTVTVDDPTSQAPSGTLAAPFNPDVTLAVTTGQSKVQKLSCARFRDSSGNINISTATPANSTLIVIGVA